MGKNLVENIWNINLRSLPTCDFNVIESIEIQNNKILSNLNLNLNKESNQNIKMNQQ